MTNNRIRIFDTTLRDGEQSPGASLNLEEKLAIAQQLARLGVDIIEAGFPFASPGDFNAVQRIAATVGLDYTETRLDRSGSPTGPTTTLQLRNRYVFARDNGNWRLVSFRRAAG